MSLTSRILGGLLLAALAFGAVQTYRLDSAKDYHREYVMAIQERLIEAYKQRNEERDKADQLSAEIGNAYLKGVSDANKLHDITIARLSADNNELRQHWQKALRRAASAEAQLAGGSNDAETRAVQEDLAAFVREAAAGDAHIMSLQDQLNAYLCQVNGEPFPGYQCSR